MLGRVLSSDNWRSLATVRNKKADTYKQTGRLGIRWCTRCDYQEGKAGLRAPFLLPSKKPTRFIAWPFLLYALCPMLYALCLAPCTCLTAYRSLLTAHWIVRLARPHADESALDKRYNIFTKPKGFFSWVSNLVFKSSANRYNVKIFRFKFDYVLSFSESIIGTII